LVIDPVVFPLGAEASLRGAKGETTGTNSWGEIRPHQAMDGVLPDPTVLPEDMVTASTPKGLRTIGRVMIYMPKDGVP